MVYCPPVLWNTSRSTRTPVAGVASVRTTGYEPLALNVAV